jgi:hypothetical protein
MIKPCSLAINSSGSWKTLGYFDASYEHQANEVMTAATNLLIALNAGKPSKQWPTLRITADDALIGVLMYWSRERGWYDNPRAVA